MENDRRPVYSHCWKDNHTFVECYKKRNVCLRCDKPDHWVKDYPMMKIKDRLKTQGRVLSLTEQEAKASTSVIRGTISSCGAKARVLIDPGSSHSFIAPRFTCYLSFEFACLDFTLVVCMSVGDSMETDRIYRQCGITIDGCDLPVNLIILDIQDFDVILGMDWLYKHHATVNCHEKMVTFKRSGQIELHFEGTRDTLPLHFISALWASRLLANS
ncbi:uncharacterized protein LOC105421918 [Amborella trichopoda]|uniref:uncharacterized protein LOC105421918 n=1 Tax=Amborella trichopoda TaxID=13333 RepID=UPI0005D4315C|nr:uncharacterized protein LOC105421918 [Amborella trichopoda]|eukprot:XP_011629337.1 uncharacterized protein LOC105421918 [Amborella trichopoda]